MRQFTTFRSDPVWNLLGEVLFDNTRYAPNETLSFTPTSDVHETDDSYLLSVDLPGVSEKEIHIEVQPGHLKLSGERKRAAHRSERQHGRFERSFTLPQNVRSDGVEARFENGVLEILLPKAAMAKSRAIEVNKERGGLFSQIISETNSLGSNH